MPTFAWLLILAPLLSFAALMTLALCRMAARGDAGAAARREIDVELMR